MIQMSPIMSAAAPTIPSSGASERRDQHLLPEPVPRSRRPSPTAATGRADHAADQRVARARGQAEVPRDQVPGDRADQSGEHDLERDRVGSTIPLATVAATSIDTNAPAKLRIAALTTAARGESARVETLVAIEFAVSWKPLVKSKKSATATTATSVRLTSIGSG